MIRSVHVLGMIGVVAALGGCGSRDPYRRTDVWRPTGANAANISAMVADPKDLMQGRGTPRTDTKAAVIAVDRVNSDRPRPLPSTLGVSNIAGQGSGGGGNGGGGGGSSGGGSGGGAGTSSP